METALTYLLTIYLTNILVTYFPTYLPVIGYQGETNY
jgi:hypothetical protein